MRALFRALSAVLALLMIALISALITMRLAIHRAEVRVPALSGLTVAEAVQHLHALGLQGGIDGRFYSTTQPAGRMLTQSPAPGTKVRKSWRVRVTESLGPQKIAIPDVGGMDISLATITVRRVGLQVGDTLGLPYAYAPVNTVIAQTPMAQATDVQAPKVSLLTAEPAPPVEAASVMPDLTGESFTAAALAIVHGGFKLAPLRNIASPLSTLAAQPGSSAGTSSSTPPAGLTAIPSGGASSPHVFASSGTVIAQSPAAGDKITAGQTVQLTVQP
jgi:beta-lactam-binding protein with PASTA domain